MPILYQQNINSDVKIGVWKITEPDDFFISESIPYRRIHHPKKQSQHLAGRYLLHWLHPTCDIQELIFPETGKPFFNQQNACFFSVSHTASYAAVIVGAHNEVGIDVEVISEKALKLRSRFLSDEEMELLESIFNTSVSAATAGWCVKEAVFKWYGKGKVDFLNDINLCSVKHQEGEIEIVCFFRKEKESKLNVHIKMLDDLVLAWVC